MAGLQRVVDRLNGTKGSILDLLVSIGMDPGIHLAGGDWRECDFQGLDLRDIDMRHARLYRANFANALVAGANFSGADIIEARLHLAKDWRSAILDGHQFVYLEGSPGAGRDLGWLAAREREGGTLTIWQYVALMKASANYAEAHSIYERMCTRGLESNRHVFTTLMDKARDYDVARDLMDEAISMGLEFDEPMVVALMSNASSLLNAFTRSVCPTKSLEPQTFRSRLDHLPSARAAVGRQVAASEADRQFLMKAKWGGGSRNMHGWYTRPDTSHGGHAGTYCPWAPAG